MWWWSDPPPRCPYQLWASRAEQLSAGHLSRPGLKPPHFSAKVPWGFPSVPSPRASAGRPGAGLRGEAARAMGKPQALPPRCLSPSQSTLCRRGCLDSQAAGHPSGGRTPHPASKCRWGG
ncbi:myelin expression factor 2 [Platysternon megacephalum]|uniref:Myelin expression factor 2 n=1 Tax=Platysternon megacephalum TaxID=55544 RepID=A0A4D9DH09_9SAUR|nr:myelin expression factor 2 [Platysternon megacephalum]